MGQESKITNLSKLLNEITSKYKNRILYRQNNDLITYENFGKLVEKLKNSLINMGLNDKKIAIISENRYEWEVSFFAVIGCNSIFVPIDKSWSQTEIENVINKAEVEAVFCSKKYEQILYKVKAGNEYLKYIISFDSENEDSFKDLIKKGQEDVLTSNNKLTLKETNKNETCLILFTSGTTSTSKAVMLSHNNICSDIINVSQIFDLKESDIVLSVLPLNHVFEGVFGFLISLYKGCERIFCNELDEIIDYIHNYKISFMCGVPAIYDYLYKRKEELVLEKEHINLFISGGAKLNPEMISKYKEIGITLIQGYGLTECSPIVSIENKSHNRKGSVGRVIPNVEVKIKNIDEEQTGELLVKGENVTKGYFKDEKETNNVIEDEWFNTGDLVKIDNDGYIYILGRNKNTIVLDNGKKIFPEEIEMLLNNIKGVKESFVFNIENDDKNKIYARIIYDIEIFKGLDISHIKSALLKEINKINNLLSTYKKINDIIIDSKPLERTDTGKIKRKIELEKSIYEYSKNRKIANQVEFNDNIGTIKNIFISKLEIENIEIDTEFTELGMDSLDRVEIFLEIEKSLNIQIPKEKKHNIKSIRDIINTIS